MNRGVRLRDLVEGEKHVRLVRFHSYHVPAGVRHQIVHNKRGEDIGIALSNNGRRDFRMPEKDVFYFFTGPYAYVALEPIRSYGPTIDLDKLV